MQTDSHVNVTFVTRKQKNKGRKREGSQLRPYARHSQGHK